MQVTWTKREGPTDTWDGTIEGSALVAMVTDITCGDYEVELRDPGADEEHPIFVDWVCHTDPAKVLADAEELINRGLLGSVL
jgi:hypothetical protein